MVSCPGCAQEIEDGGRFCPFCGTQVALATQAGPADPYLGRLLLGKFQIEARLGEGGMGRVYRAVQQPLERTVVLKILHRRLMGDASLTARFQLEARAASRLSHPSCVQVTDFGALEDGALYLAMEYVDGQTLGALIQAEGPLAEARAARLVEKVCEGVAAAHEAQILHRDLKPDNIMVISEAGGAERVKVVDFGIAKLLDKAEGDPSLTELGMVCGTPEYMSPEQARGEALDPRSDIYALGVVLFHALTGELPFTAPTSVGVVSKHITEAPPRPRALRPELSEDIEALVLRCLAKAPAQRPESAQALAAALGALAGGGARAQTVEVEVVPAAGEGGVGTPLGLPASASSSPVPALAPAEGGAPRGGVGLWGVLGLVVAIAAVGALALGLVSGATRGGGDPVEAAPSSEAAPAAAPVAEAPVAEKLAADRLAAGAEVTERAEADTQGSPGESAPEAKGEAGEGAAAAKGDALTAAGPAGAGAAADGADATGAGVTHPAVDESRPIDSKLDDSPPAKTSRRRPKRPKAGPAPRPTPTSRAQREASQRALSLGRRAWADGRFDEAIRQYVLAAEADPNSAMAHRLLGMAYVSRGQRGRARAPLRRYLELAPLAPDRRQVEAIIAKR